MTFLTKLSKLGIFFVVVHVLLILLIPLWVKIFGRGCGFFFCALTAEEVHFMFFNLPGLFITSFEPAHNLLHQIEPSSVRQTGEIFIGRKIVEFLISSIFFYFTGFGVEKLWKKFRK